MFPSHAPAELYELFTDPSFLEEFSREVGVAEHHADLKPTIDGETTVHLMWKFPTDMAPAVVRPFLPPNVELTWTTSWAASDTTTRRDGTFAMRSDNPWVTFDGSTSLAEDDVSGTGWRVSGPVHAKRKGIIPGSAIGGLLERLFRAVLEDQATVAERRLGILRTPQSENQ